MNGPKSIRARCTVHGIALSDDGRCVLCRRTSAPPPASFAGGEPQEASGGVLARFWVTAALVLCAVAAYAGFREWRAAASRRPAPVVAVSPEPPEAMLQAAADSSAQVRQPPRTNAPAPRPTGATRADIRAAERRDREQEARQRALAKQQADYEAWAHREATKQIEEDEARARGQRSGAPQRSAPYEGTSRSAANADARRRVAITMYSTSWCGYCRQARAYMQAHGIPFAERDIERDASAQAEAHRLNPRGSVPVIQVGGERGMTLVGFNPGRLEEAIDAAASRY